MVADNSTLNVTVVRDNTSGTGGTNWTVDVTVCNLSTDISVKDFLVTHNGTVINNTNYTKNSPTQITYTGTALTGATTVTVIRRTPPTRLTEVVFGTKLSTANYEAELNRIHRILNEFELNGPQPEGLVDISDTAFGVVWNGIVGVAPSQNAVYDKIISMINDAAYGAGWDGDTLSAPSRNALYDRLVLLATLASPAFSGTPTAPTPAQYTNTTQIATAQFVNRSHWPMVIANAPGSQSINHTTPTDINLTETLDTSNAFASNVFTAPVAGVYEVRAGTSFTAATGFVVATIRVNAGTDTVISNAFAATDIVSGTPTGSLLLNLAVNDTVRLRIQQNSWSSTARTVATGTHFSINYLGAAS